MQTTDSKFTTRNISRLYGAAYKFVNMEDMFYCFMFFERTKSSHSGMFHCLGMNLVGTRDIFSHSGAVPGNPGQLVTLLYTTQTFIFRHDTILLLNILYFVIRIVRRCPF